MKKITEEIYYDNGSRLLRIHPAVRNGYVLEVGSYYSFELWRKPAVFGGVAVDQFWMKLDSIYGRHGAEPRNYDELVEHYLAQSKQAVTILDDEVLDSYILAKLLPYVRRYGSRKIFDDAILSCPQPFGKWKQDLVRQLEEKLAASRHGALDMETFHKHTNRLLGKPDMSASVDACYRELADELLGEGRRAVGRWGQDGLQVPIQKMQSWMKSFARRGDQKDKTLALDMLSYECRAALHRCYSAVWFELLTHLERKYDLDEPSVQFHRLMHFDIQLPSNLPAARFHLFHGHVFALHPGLSLFFQTPTGGELVADYLRGTVDDGPFRRLLNGFWVALGDYYVRSDEIADGRKRSSRDEKSADIEAVAAAQTKGRGHRSLGGPKRT